MAENEGPKTLEEAIAALKDAQESVAALTRKNAELLNEKRSTKSGAEAKMADLEQEVADLKEQVAKGARDSKSALEKVTKERDELAKSLAETSTKKRDYETSVTLRESLAKLGIGKLNAEDVTDAMGFVKSMLTYDDKGNALVSYKDANGKDVQQALGEYVDKVYPTTTHAKRFIPADGNRGAGAGLRKPGQSEKKGSAGNPWVKESFNLTRQIDLIRTNKAEAVRLAAEAGVTIE